MIERDGPLSLSRQCALLGVSRSSQYYRPKGESAEDLALMRLMGMEATYRRPRTSVASLQRLWNNTPVGLPCHS